MRVGFLKDRPLQIWALFFILLLAGVLRFWQLGQVPSSPDWDEAALGYNAYSLMKTGRDEYGQPFPFILRSFDDYKPAIYTYFIIPAIMVFGLNTFAVRFPAALLGTLAVLVVYFLVKELFFAISPPRRSTSGRSFDPSRPPRRCFLALPLIVSFLLAISPWHLQFSRIAFETNVGMLVNMIVALFFLKGLKKPLFLYLAAFFAGLNIYVYQAEKMFTPLLVLAMAVIWRKELLRLPRKYLVGAIGVGLIMVLPFAHMALTKSEVFMRAKGTSVAADQTPFLARTVEKLSRDQRTGDFFGLLIDNRRVTYGLSVINGYLSHFDLNWLFIRGDEARHHAPGMGLMYLWELPFLLLGIYYLCFSQLPKKSKYFLAAWLFLAPLPASFTSGVPHAVRTLRLLPVLPIIVALGLVMFWSWLKDQKKILKFFICVFGFSFFIFNVSYYLNQYFVQQNYFNSQSWQYGYQEAIEAMQQSGGSYRKVVVSNQQPLDQSYMFFLFHLKYDPVKYLREGGTVSGGFNEQGNRFGRYEFRPIDWSKEEKSKDILYIGKPLDFPGDKPVVKTIYYLDGEPAIKLVEGG